MKEQVSMMRSAWSVVTSWRRWRRSLSDAGRRFWRILPSSFGGVTSDC